MTTIVSAKNLTKTYHYGVTRESFVRLITGSGVVQRNIPSISNLDLSIAASEAVALIGENGSGKSTLLRVLAGILKPSSGTIEVSGKTIPILFPGACMYNALDIEKNLDNAFIFGGVKKKESRLLTERVLKDLHLTSKAKLPLGSLSKGMIAAVTLAVGFSSDGALYLVDELFDCLHNDYRGVLRDMLKNRLQRGASVVIATHDSNVVSEICSRTITLSRS